VPEEGKMEFYTQSWLAAKPSMQTTVNREIFAALKVGEFAFFNLR
jgi:hypothetical protein